VTIEKVLWRFFWHQVEMDWMTSVEQNTFDEGDHNPGTVVSRANDAHLENFTFWNSGFLKTVSPNQQRTNFD
jgi:hypothetical protein